MTSIFEQAMGEDFARLHPMLQRRFGVGLASGEACVGQGSLTVRRGPWWTVPFLWFGAVRNILVPITGDGVPFTISNFPYRDPMGRETVTFVREYRARGRVRRFDATMVLHEGRVLDYLGTHQHLAVDLDLEALPDGSLHLTTGAQRFYEGPVGFRFPMLLSGRADLHEWFDDDAGTFGIRMQVRNRLFGFLFGYEGTFTCEFLAADDAPDHLKPVRHEQRT